MMDWKRLISAKRFGMEEFHEERQENRSELQQDYDRLVFFVPFRRLQDKTQVFPLPDSIFIHNRLTHSLEVSCVGRSLGNDASKATPTRQPQLQDSLLPEINSIVSAACLAHDLGNPPFGRSGEKTIFTLFSEGKGTWLQDQLSPMEWDDLTHFEENANAFRLLIHQFEGHRKEGFVLTYFTLAFIVKYSSSSNLTGNKSKFGFSTTEEGRFYRIATELGLIQISGQPLKHVRHPLVCPVETADDICYQVMDIEDAHKLKIPTMEGIKELSLAYFTGERQLRIRKMFSIVNDTSEQIACLRSFVIGPLIKECIRALLDNETEILSDTFEGPLIKHIPERPEKVYKHCSEVSFKKVYRSRDVLDIKLAGFRVINTFPELMIDVATLPEKVYSQLPINRVSGQHNIKAPALYERIQAMLGYILDMTDVSVLDLYRKIDGNSLPMM